MLLISIQSDMDALFSTLLHNPTKMEGEWTWSEHEMERNAHKWKEMQK